MAVETKAIFPDGTPVPSGWCLSPDHYLTTFTVRVKSLRPISEATLLLLLSQYEAEAEKTEEVCVVRNTPPS